MGEAPARTEELSNYVSQLRETISALTRDIGAKDLLTKHPSLLSAAAWLREECGLDDTGAIQAVEYIVESRALLGAVPTKETIIAERFFDEAGGMHVIIHSPFGARVNKAWGLALRKHFQYDLPF